MRRILPADVRYSGIARNHVKPALGRLALDKVDAPRIQRLYAQMHDDGYKPSDDLNGSCRHSPVAGSRAEDALDRSQRRRRRARPATARSRRERSCLRFGAVTPSGARASPPWPRPLAMLPSLALPLLWEMALPLGLLIGFPSLAQARWPLALLYSPDLGYWLLALCVLLLSTGSLRLILARRRLHEPGTRLQRLGSSSSGESARHLSS
jgi:hypothetical protein